MDALYTRVQRPTVNDLLTSLGNEIHSELLGMSDEEINQLEKLVENLQGAVIQERTKRRFDTLISRVEPPGLVDAPTVGDLGVSPVEETTEIQAVGWFDVETSSHSAAHPAWGRGD